MLQKFLDFDNSEVQKTKAGVVCLSWHAENYRYLQFKADNYIQLCSREMEQHC